MRGLLPCRPGPGPRTAIYPDVRGCGTVAKGPPDAKTKLRLARALESEFALPAPRLKTGRRRGAGATARPAPKTRPRRASCYNRGMYSRWFSVAVVLFWVATMGWLIHHKILPPLVVGDPPTYRSIIAD